MTAVSTERSTERQYVFGIVASGHPVPTSIDQIPVRTTTCDGVAAVHQGINTRALESAVDDESVARLADLARRHDAVVVRLAVDGPVLPMRFGTLCADDEHLRELLHEAHSTLRHALAEVRGHSEWTVRLHSVPGRPSSAVSPAVSSAVSSSAASGAGYLLQRQRELRTTARRRGDRDGVIADLDARLSAQATRACSLRSADVLVARAYLVPDPQAAQFVAELVGARDRLARADLTMRVEGPLPPYSFADIRLQAPS